MYSNEVETIISEMRAKSGYIIIRTVKATKLCLAIAKVWLDFQMPQMN